MIVYEVNCLIDNDISEEFEEWLPAHVREMLTLDGFISAETYQIIEDDQLSARETARETARKGTVGISIRYYLKDKNALNNYLENHAESMRKDGKDRFTDQFSAYRRVLLKSA